MHPTPQLANALLSEWSHGDAAAESRLQDLISQALIRVLGWYLHSEARPRIALDSALVHVAYLHLASERTSWQDRARFLAAGAQVLRRILVGHARSRVSNRTDEDALPSIDNPAPLLKLAPQQLIALHNALERLAQSDRFAARVAEMRLFGELSIADSAVVLSCEPGAVSQAWSAARTALAGGAESPEPVFRSPWTGASYDLAIYLDDPSDACLQGALEALWSHPSLEGCYLRRDLEPHQQDRVAARIGPRLGGVATLPDRSRTACGSGVSRWGQGEGAITAQTLWFGLPLNGLGRSYPVGGYPFGEFDAARYWRPILDSWLMEIARSIHAIAPWEIAEIGFDLALTPERAAELRRDGVLPGRNDGVLVWEAGRMVWYPPTNP